MKARILANKNFTSAEMNYEQAVIYAWKLEQRGNVNVRVVPLP